MDEATDTGANDVPQGEEAPEPVDEDVALIKSDPVVLDPEDKENPE